MEALKILCFTTLFLLTTACTTNLKVQKIKESNFSSIGTGIVYFLPQQSLNVAVTYAVQSCANGKANISRRAAITASNQADESAQFSILTSELSSRLKTTSLTVGTYDDGTLRSLGAEVNDRSAETLNGVVGAAASIARVVTGAALSSDAPCSKMTEKYWAARTQLIEDLQNPTLYTDEDERASAVDVLSRLNASLSFVRNIAYTPNRAEKNVQDRVSREFTKSGSTENMLKRWFGVGNNDDLVTKLLNITICIHPGNDNDEKIAEEYRGCNGNSLLKIDELSSVPSDGLIYREPRRVRIVVCGDSCKDGTIGQATIALAQLGDWRSIELESKAFQNKNAMASWSQSGRLMSLTIGGSSSLEALTGALNSSTNTAREAISEIITTDIEQLNAEVAIVRAEADLLEQRARLLGLQMMPETINEDEGE